jgi:hypothetical protein
LPTIGALSLLSCVVLYWEIINRLRNAGLWDASMHFQLVIFPLWATLCLTSSLMLLIAALLSSALPRLYAERRMLRLGRPAFGLIMTVVILAILAQWAWATYGKESIWFRAVVETDVLTNLGAVYDQVLGWPSLTLPLSLFVAVLDFPLILGLAGFVGVLSAAGRARQSPFLSADQRWIKWSLGVLFAAFVISYGGGVLGLQAPLAFGIGLVLLRLAWSDRIGVASERIDKRNGAPGETPLIVRQRGALLHRAIALANLDRKRAKARRDLDGESMEAQNYIQTLGELEVNARRIRHRGAGESGTGDPSVSQRSESPKSAPVLLALGDLKARARSIRHRGVRDDGASDPNNSQSSVTPTGTPVFLSARDAPGELALAAGPEKGWWDNGVLAVRLGGLLAVVPIGYFMVVFLTSRGGAEWSLNSPFAITGFAAALLYEIAFWLVAALVFGCVFPYLYGPNGAVKGAVLAAVYVGANAAAALIGIPGNALWQVRSFQLLLFLMLLGTWLNLKTVELHGLGWRDLMDLYDLPKATTIIGQGLPLVTAIAAVVLQLLLGQTQQATENLVTGDASKAILSFFRSQASTD